MEICVFLHLGGMQDYNYAYASCYELTLEVSCCKYPPGSQLKNFWDENQVSLVKYLQQVHMGKMVRLKNRSNVIKW